MNVILESRRGTVFDIYVFIQASHI